VAVHGLGHDACYALIVSGCSSAPWASTVTKRPGRIRLMRRMGRRASRERGISDGPHRAGARTVAVGRGPRAASSWGHRRSPNAAGHDRSERDHLASARRERRIPLVRPASAPSSRSPRAHDSLTPRPSGHCHA